MTASQRLEIEDQIPPSAAAVVIHEDGSVSLMVPKSGEEEPIGPHVLAATEIMIRIVEGDLALHEMAEAFKAREPN